MNSNSDIRIIKLAKFILELALRLRNQFHLKIAPSVNIEFAMV